MKTFIIGLVAVLSIISIIGLTILLINNYPIVGDVFIWIVIISIMCILIYNVGKLIKEFLN